MSKSSDPRVEFRITVVPDPILRETLENLNFSPFPDQGCWIRTCDPDEAALLQKLLNGRQIPFEAKPSRHVGKLVRFPKLSDELAIPDGGGAGQCGLCGHQGPCTPYIECDDADNPDYPGAAKFYVCRPCAKRRIGPHPRLYVQMDESDSRDDSSNPFDTGGGPA